MSTLNFHTVSRNDTYTLAATLSTSNREGGGVKE